MQEPSSGTPDRRGLAPAAFRAELVEFLDTHHPGRTPGDDHAALAFQRAWQATLHDHGWVAPGWPREVGGMGLPLDLQVVYHREMAAARTPLPPNNFVGIVGPTLIAHGTDAQRDRYLRPMLRTDALWCQGFSEPGAGSDLASLTTRAVRDGDVYRVSGRKIWISKAAIADHMLALVRTGSPGSGSAGISCLVVDMAAPGVSVQPIRDMTGGAYFAEVTLDGVEVAVDHLVGRHDDGWRCARATLGHERSTSLAAAALRYQRVVGSLVRLAERRGALGSEVHRQDLARLLTEARLLELNGARVLGHVLDGSDPGPLSSVNRLQHGLFEQRLHEAALRLLGADAVLGHDEPALGTDARWVTGFLRTRASTIGAGTAEIQRSTIAQRVLGMPSDRVLP